MPKVEFIKERFYKNKKYNIGSVAVMDINDSKTYINAGAVRYYKKPPRVKNLEDMEYKQLQTLCKKNNVKAVGSKEELINQLKEKGVFK